MEVSVSVGEGKISSKGGVFVAVIAEAGVDNISASGKLQEAINREKTR
jgi:hypothetical protein